MMLEDVVRTTSYEDALKEVVTGSSHVIDFGTGTGVLAIFAARAGAARVDAVDRSSFLKYAKRIAKSTGFPDIRFHHADHETLILDKKADILVSEWMGHFLFYEAMMGPLLKVRDKWLAESGTMVPASVSMHAALLIDESFHDERTFFLGNPYGIDFSIIADQPLRQVRRVRALADQLDASRFHLGTLDMKTVTGQPEVLRARGKVRQAALSYGIIAWFDTQLTPKVRFGTGPDDAPTHWEHLYFPFPEPYVVVPDRELSIEIRPPSQPEDEDPTWAWGISDGEVSVFIDEKETFAEAARDPDEELAP
jgi:protein arginine N-methyltransferase 1